MPDLAAIKDDIEAAWEARDGLSPTTQEAFRTAIEVVLARLDSGVVSRF